MKVKKDNKKKGDYYENIAAVFLENKMGYHILSRNYRKKFGEIDIIAKDNEYIVFIEVKYRKDTQFGYPEEAVNHKKQQKIIYIANEYLKNYNINTDIPIRFDIVSILSNKIKVIKNAFSI